MTEKKKKIIRKIIVALPIMFLVIPILFSFASHAHAAWIEPIYQVLSDTSSGMGANIARVWQYMMYFVNGIVLIALIYVAFMNILRIQLDSYAVKKFLPTFIMAVILANFSFLIARIIIDLGNIAISLFLFGSKENHISGAFNSLIGDRPPKLDVSLPSDSEYIPAAIAYIIKQWVLIVGAVLVFVLSLIFLIRNYLIYVLVAIAPIAFMAMVLPITKKYFQQWWAQFTKWVFMPVIAVFWLWLAGQFLDAINVGETWFLPTIFACLCFYMAITSSLKADKLVGTWYGWGKKALGFSGRQVAGTGARTAEFGQKLQKRYPKEAWQAKTGKYLEKTGGLINVPATYRALKKGREFRMAELAKAEVKTGTYGRAGGPNVRIEAERAKTEDELKYSTPKVTAQNMAKIEDPIMQAINDASNRSREKLTMVAQLKSLTGVETDEEFEGISQADKRDALRRYLASDGVPNILLKFRGLGGQLKNEKEAVLAEGHSRNFIQFARGRYTTRPDLAGSYEDPTIGRLLPEIRGGRRTAGGPGGGAPRGGTAPVTAEEQARRARIEADEYRQMFGTEPPPAPGGGAPGGGAPGGGAVPSSAVPGAQRAGQPPAAAGEAREEPKAEIDFGEITNRLDNIAGKLGQNPDTLAAAIAKAMQLVKQIAPDNIGLGLAAVPELRVRVTGVDPQGRMDFLRIFNTAGKKSADAERRLLEGNAQIIQNLRRIGEQGNAQQVLDFSEQGENEIEGGE